LTRLKYEVLPLSDISATGFEAARLLYIEPPVWLT